MLLNRLSIESLMRSQGDQDVYGFHPVPELLHDDMDELPHGRRPGRVRDDDQDAPAAEIALSQCVCKLTPYLVSHLSPP